MPGAPVVRGGVTKPALGGGFHLGRDLTRLRLRDWRVLAPDRELACILGRAHRPGAGCPGAGVVRTLAVGLDGLIDQSDGARAGSIRYTARLGEAGTEPSVGSRGDSKDNALAESVVGLLKTEVIRARRTWRRVAEIEFATLEWIDWFNDRWHLEPLGDPQASSRSGTIGFLEGLAAAA